MTDKEFETLKKEKQDNKRIIKQAGFKIKSVKRVYRLFDAEKNLIAERPTYYGEMETVKSFAELVKTRKFSTAGKT